MIIPIPQHDESTLPIDQRSSPSVEWVRWYLSAPNWQCPKCDAVMMGRMQFCVYCKFRLGVNTPKPD